MVDNVTQLRRDCPGIVIPIGTEVVLKKGSQVYVEGQLTTRKWKDEQSGQDKYSTEIILQGYNSTLTMLGGANTNNISNNLSNKNNDFDQTNQQNNSDLDDEIPF